MKTPLRSLLAAVCLAALTSVGLASQAQIGQPAPDFTLTSIKGMSHSLSDFRGKTVVLEWMNQECPFVVKHYERSGNMPALQKQAAEDGVIWLIINSGKPGAQGDFSEEQVKAWMQKTGAAPTAYFRDQSGDVGRLYGARVTPHMYVINPAGILVYNGAIDSIRSANAADIAQAENYLTAALQAVAAGGMPERTTTQPYGCTVKY
jgi:hypothetical protein